jgi:hypothetical protein
MLDRTPDAAAVSGCVRLFGAAGKAPAGTSPFAC